MESRTNSNSGLASVAARKRHDGFSLLELLATLAVIVVLWALTATAAQASGSVLSSFGGQQAQASSEADATAMLAAVRSDWSLRQQETESLLVKFQSARTDATAALVVDLDSRKVAAEAGRFAQHTVEAELRLLRDWFDVRLVRINPPGLLQPAHRDTFGPHGSQSLTTMRPNTPRFGSPPYAANVSSGQYEYGVQDAVLRAPLIAYRGLSSGICGFELNSARMLPERRTWNGVDCVRIDDGGARASRTEIWLDPERGFSPVRWISSVRDSPSVEFQMSYGSGSDNCDCPLTGWSYKWVNSRGELMHSEDVVVTAISTGEHLTDRDFVIEIPPGTLVYDKDAGTNQIVAGINAVLPAAVRGSDGQSQLIAAVKPLLACTAVAVAVVAMWYWRRLRVEKASSDNRCG
jgi:prepilin-type N-terminal cleavage/methylation domain-containing protein